MGGEGRPLRTKGEGSPAGRVADSVRRGVCALRYSPRCAIAVLCPVRGSEVPVPSPWVSGFRVPGSDGAP